MQSSGPTFDEQSRSWLLTRYVDVCAVLLDDRFRMAPAEWSRVHRTSLTALITQQLLFRDGADHQRLRALIGTALTPLVKLIHHPIRARVQQTLDRLAEHERFDSVSAFAVPVITYTIAQVLGMPTQDEDHLMRVRHWSDAFEHITSGFGRSSFSGDMIALKDYFHQLARTPTPPSSLLAAFVAHHQQFQDEDEMAANLIMLLAAGRATCEKLLGTGLRTLLAEGNPLRRGTFHRQRAVEELLRVITPTRWISRWATEDVEVGGARLRAGQKVMLILEAANHDPAQFASPDHFDLQRLHNQHLAFGHPKNRHYCIGAPLARIEAGIALEMLLDRFPNLHIDASVEPTWQPNPNLGGLLSLPLFTSTGH
jgi:cytochrome P450